MAWKNYDFDDVLDFGKYEGKKVRTVVGMDPKYIIWASMTVTKFNPTKEVLSEARNAHKN